MFKNIIKTGLLAAALTLSGCDSYLDINTSPNSPSAEQLTTSDIFPGAEIAVCTSYCGEMKMFGGYYSQHFGNVPGSSNYNPNSQFQVSPATGGFWYNLYVKALNNLAVVIEKADAEGDKATKLAAVVMRATAFTALVDAYGEVPYTESVNVTDYPMSHFDEGKTVYDGILAELEEALQGVLPTDLVCKNFLFSDGKAEGWIRTANALRLRMLMRMADVENVQSKVSAIIAENYLPTSDVAWAGFWTDQNEKCNPYYRGYGDGSYCYTKKNISLNLAVVRTMEAADDPRMPAVMQRNNEGKFYGGISGNTLAEVSGVTVGKMSLPNITYNSPAYLITVAEIEFFKAEYEARYGSQTAAAEHYQAAIEASCSMYGVDYAQSIIDAFPYDPANWKNSIGVQKWIHLSGSNNWEAWCELRRLGYPAFGTVTGADLFNGGDLKFELYQPGTLYTPYTVSATVGQNHILQRFPYPNDASSRNSNCPENKGDLVPIFWAAK